jgi:hypothetical protein
MSDGIFLAPPSGCNMVSFKSGGITRKRVQPPAIFCDAFSVREEQDTREECPRDGSSFVAKASIADFAE